MSDVGFTLFPVVLTGKARSWSRRESSASPRAGGFETRPYRGPPARRPVRPDWIPAFAGMTEGRGTGVHQGRRNRTPRPGSAHVRVGAPLVGARLVRSGQPQGLPLHRTRIARWPRLRAAWEFVPAASCPLIPLVGTGKARSWSRRESSASPRAGGFETRPYRGPPARRPVRPDWIPAFAGMTEGLHNGLRTRDSKPGRAPVRVGAPLVGTRLVRSGQPQGLPLHRPSVARWPRLRAAWEFVPAASCPLIPLVGTEGARSWCRRESSASPRAGGFETRPYRGQAAIA